MIQAIGTFAITALACLLLAETIIRVFKLRRPVTVWVYVHYVGTDDEGDRCGGWTLFAYRGDEPPSIEALEAMIVKNYKVTSPSVTNIITLK